MILAAAKYAERQGEAPEELMIGLTCEKFQALPVAGGVLDQPAGLMNRMRAALNVYHGYEGYLRVMNADQSKLGEWIKAYPTGWEAAQLALKAVKGQVNDG